MNRNTEIIKENLTLRDVMEFYGISFNRRGFALCPFHNEKTASLSIKNEHYKCFGCGAYGGVIDFIMEYFNLTFKQAITKLGSDFALPLSFRKPAYRERLKIAEKRRKTDAERAENAKIKKIIDNNYNALCELHRRLYGEALKRKSETLLEYVDIISDVLDDFSGKEALEWPRRLQMRFIQKRIL
mgnify:FL=1